MENNENLKNLLVHRTQCKEALYKISGQKIKNWKKIVSQRLHEKTSKSGADAEGEKYESTIFSANIVRILFYFIYCVKKIERLDKYFRS